MWANHGRRITAVALAAALGGVVGGTTAGTLGRSGSDAVLGTRIVVCFVGDATTSQPGFVARIRDYLRAHQAAANIDYEFPAACPAPTMDTNGRQIFGGDLRVVIPGTSVPYSPAPNAGGERLIPGTGCTRAVPVVWDPMSNRAVLDPAGNQIDTGASFGIFPFERQPATDVHCQYNMRLGDDGVGGVPWRNHTLHEFGHSLGFAHEFDRFDARAAVRSAACSRNADGTDSNWFTGLPLSGGGNSLITTEAYDMASTMNYSIANCGYEGNYSNSGLSELEKISLHFMYPEDDRVAEYIGRTVLREGETLRLVALWPPRGASISRLPMIKRYEWRIDGAVRASGPSATSLSMALPGIGVYRLDLSYVDFADRQYAVSSLIRVLPDSSFRALAATVTAAHMP